jgi:hypothetical protein
MKLIASLGVAVSLAACIPTVPPAPPVPHEAMQVNAPAAKTWDAVIDVFAAKNIPIKTLDHSSGFIAAEEMRVPRPEGRGAESPYADCGTMNKIPQVPTHANYNIRVKGDSTRSTVQVTVLWKDVYDVKTGSTTQCSTKGTWETDAETEIKKRAETR